MKLFKKILTAVKQPEVCLKPPQNNEFFKVIYCSNFVSKFATTLHRLFNFIIDLIL